MGAKTRLAAWTKVLADPTPDFPQTPEERAELKERQQAWMSRQISLMPVKLTLIFAPFAQWFVYLLAPDSHEHDPTASGEWKLIGIGITVAMIMCTWLCLPKPRNHWFVLYYAVLIVGTGVVVPTWLSTWDRSDSWRLIVGLICCFGYSCFLSRSTDARDSYPFERAHPAT